MEALKEEMNMYATPKEGTYRHSVLRTAYMAAAAANEKPVRVSSGLGPEDDTVVETPHFEVHNDDNDTIPTRE